MFPATQGWNNAARNVENQSLWHSILPRRRACRRHEKSMHYEVSITIATVSTQQGRNPRLQILNTAVPQVNLPTAAGLLGKLLLLSCNGKNQCRLYQG